MCDVCMQPALKTQCRRCTSMWSPNRRQSAPRQSSLECPLRPATLPESSAQLSATQQTTWCPSSIPQRAPRWARLSVRWAGADLSKLHLFPLNSCALPCVPWQIACSDCPVCLAVLFVPARRCCAFGCLQPACTINLLSIGGSVDKHCAPLAFWRLEPDCLLYFLHDMM